jgi:tRNA dimethylallyltransferase
LHTRQFAKRQRTWFRMYPEIEWFDAEQPDLLEQVWERVQEFRESLVPRSQHQA